MSPVKYRAHIFRAVVTTDRAFHFENWIKLPPFSRRVPLRILRTFGRSVTVPVVLFEYPSSILRYGRVAPCRLMHVNDGQRERIVYGVLYSSGMETRLILNWG